MARKWIKAEEAEEKLKKPEPAPKKKGGAALLYGAKEEGEDRDGTGETLPVTVKRP